MNTRKLMGCVTVVLLLGACGGGGGDDALGATESVPDSANASVGGMKRWLAQLAATAPEDREPLDATRFAPPQPDDAEPDTLQ